MTITHISYSGISTFQKCSYKYKINYVDRVRGPGSIHTSFGSAVHKCCEVLIEDENADVENIFKSEFHDQLRNSIIQEQQKEIFEDRKGKLYSLYKDMIKKGAFLSRLTIKELRKEFGNFKVISVEDQLSEPIVHLELENDYDFKGFIDLCIQTEDGFYHVLDYKTTSWGWKQSKKTDKLVSYQLSYYKHFFAAKYNIDPKKIKDTWFVLIKRTQFKKGDTLEPKDGAIEFLRISNGPIKIKNALKVLDNTLQNIDKRRFIKNKLECPQCEFYDTEYCSR